MRCDVRDLSVGQVVLLLSISREPTAPAFIEAIREAHPEFIRPSIQDACDLATRGLVVANRRAGQLVATSVGWICTLEILGANRLPAPATDQLSLDLGA
jgi:hypothetical protein